MSSLRRSFRRHRQRQQPHTSPPITPRQPTSQPARPRPVQIAAVFDYEHDHVTVACTRCRNADERGDLETIEQCSHGPLPVELAKEWFTRQDGTMLVTIPAGVPVMGYCYTCQQRTPMRLLNEQEASAASARGEIRLFGDEDDWDDE